MFANNERDTGLQVELFSIVACYVFLTAVFIGQLL